MSSPVGDRSTLPPSSIKAGSAVRGEQTGRGPRGRTLVFTLIAVALMALAVPAMTVAAAVAASHSPSAPDVRPAATPTVDSSLALALIGDDTSHLAAERAAGFTTHLFELRWREYMPKADGQVDMGYMTRMKTALAAYRAAGFKVILSLGYHDIPAWLHSTFADSYYVDQYGDRYTSGGHIDMGDANVVFNQAIRDAVARYIARVFSDFGTDFVAVRLGGGPSGELSYPPASYAGHANCYWAFDAAAASADPAPGWRPGQASPKGQAASFMAWYQGSLVNYETWQIATVRKQFSGNLMMLFPSWGIRQGQLALAVAANLGGSVSPEIPRGYDFADQVAAITDPNVLVTTTWLDADASRDGGSDSRFWSPVKYLASLAAANPLHLRLYGENTGQGSAAALRLSVAQEKRYGLAGFAWYRDTELLSGKYATFADVTAATRR